MKELRIDEWELMQINNPYASEDYLKNKLRAAGFDFNHEIIRFEDYSNHQVVYQQKEVFEKKPKNMFQLIKQYGWKRYWRYRKYYKMKLRGPVVDSFESFSSWYYTDDIGTTEIKKMKSGKYGVYKIISVTGIDDWGSKNIKKDFIGYHNVKEIRSCTLEEFMTLYYNFLKLKR